MSHQRSFFDDEFAADMAVKRTASIRPQLPNINVAELSAATRAVYLVLTDGCWHTAADIIEQTGYSEAMRRVR